MSQHVLIKTLTSEEFLALFVEDCKVRGLSPETIRRYKSITDQFLKFIGKINVRPVDVDRHTLQDTLQDYSG